MSTTIDTTTTSRTPGHVGQTILVGEEVYLRRIEKQDATHVMSWRNSVYPISPSVTKAWIGQTNNAHQWFAVVRKTDDRVVGSVDLSGNSIHTFMQVRIDPLFADAERWKAEAIRLVLPWRQEQQRITLFLTLTGDETEAIAAAQESGAFEATRLPAFVLKHGRWVDLVTFAHLSPAWMPRLGDPRVQPPVRTGNGEPRPVPPKGIGNGARSSGAILIGQRVYLKAVDKEDAAQMARFSRREIETDYGHFRAINNPENHAHRRLEDNAQRLRGDIGFAVRLRENDQFIGEVAVLDVDYRNRHGETASWMYDPAFRGSGFGSEAKHLLLDYCFNVLGLRAVASYVSTDNPRSAAALRKQGYTEAGILPWTSLQNGRLSGSYVFHLTAEAWRALPRAAESEGAPA